MPEAGGEETMSATKTNPLGLGVSPCLLAITLLALGPKPAAGESLSGYGAGMCAELGIPASQCDLAEDTRMSPGRSGKADKAETLIERARRLCTEQGVPLEHCTALPTTHRLTERDPAPFLTTPERVPVVRVAPAPVIMNAPPPVPHVTPVPQIERIPQAAPIPRTTLVPQTASVPQIAPVPQTTLVPAGNPGYRVVIPPPPPEPPLRYVDRPPVDAAFGYAAPPPPEPPYPDARPPRLGVEPAFRAHERRQGEPIFRDVELIDPPREPPFRDVISEPTQRSYRYVERSRGPERRAVTIVEEEREFRTRGERCYRAVRYSRPPSYRYVGC